MGTTLITGAGLVGTSFGQVALKRGEKLVYFDPQPRLRSAEVFARRPWLLATSARQNPAENVELGRTGGARGTGIQRSPNLQPESRSGERH